MYFFNKPQNLFDYYHFYDNLDNNLLSEISDFILNYDFEIATTVGNTESRQSKIKWIPYSDKSKDLYKILSNKIVVANNTHFNFDIVLSKDDIQYTEYDSITNGKYGWHQDGIFNNNSTNLNRKLSLTIQLSDPNEYEGGDLEIYWPHPEKGEILKVPKEKGKIIIFPSYMWHRVTPVTKGIRKSLVWWVGGSQFR